MQPRLSIVIPTYRGSATVPALLEGLWSEPLPDDLEVVLIDDGSDDDSATVLRGWLQRREPARGTVRFIELSRNFGEHSAVMAGLLEAQGALVLTMDDDLQHHPEDATALFCALLDNTAADVVYGQLGEKRHAAWRNTGSRFVDRLLGHLVGKPNDVRVSTFRCMRRRIVDEVVSYRGPFPYVDGLILQLTNRVIGLPVAHSPRAAGRSGYGFRRLLGLFLSVATGFSVLPLRLSLLAGVVMGASGLGLAGFAIWNYAVTGSVAGWTSIFVVVSLLSGFQLLMLGLVGEYVGRVLLTVSGRPQHSVRSVESF